jgi:PadR family transcriptional regulator, regulatory protein PadR
MDKLLLTQMIVELRRGTQILGVLSLLKKEQYGYSLLQSLIDEGIQIEAGTLYPLLRRLETQGLLESEWDTTEARPRKYYKLSPMGKEFYEKLKKEWKIMVDEINHVLREE